MSAKGDRSAGREVPAGGVRNSAVLGKEGGPGGESDRAIVARKPGNSGGAKGPAFRRASEAEEGQAIDMSLKTPEKTRNLQQKLYLKAKQEPNFRFYQLWDKVWRSDILEHAYRLAKANGGAAGVDGVTFQQIASQGRQEWLRSLQEDLRSKSYRPQPVRRVMIHKPGGGERALGIPTIRDRVAQSAAKLVSEPIFEADLDPEAYGYRPKRSAHDAIRRVHELLCKGYTDVVDADLSRYFDTIPHAELLQCVARRIADRQVLHVIKRWLKTPVEERDENGKRRMTGGKKSTCGTPQGGVMTPRTQKVTSCLSGCCGIDHALEVCHVQLYTYDIWAAPAMSKKPSVSISLAACCDSSSVCPMLSSRWFETVPSLLARRIVTSNKRAV